jgi:hypothetical protein
MGATADCAEAALITRTGNELAQNVICSISLRAALVDRIDDEVGSREGGEWEYHSHCSKADFRMMASKECGGVQPVRTSLVRGSFLPDGVRGSSDLSARTIEVLPRLARFPAA